MANNSQTVKRRIKSVTSMERITNAMKLLSSAKLTKARATFEKTNENFKLLEHLITEIFNGSRDELPEKYIAAGEESPEKTCYIVITSNKGLCGSFNSNVIKQVESAMAEDDSDSCIIAFGTKGGDYFARRSVPIIKQYKAPAETIDFLGVREACQPIIQSFEEGEFDKVVIVFTSYISSLNQQVVQKTLLPLEIENDPDIIQGGQEIEYEPCLTEAFNYLVAKHMETTVYRAVVESATCEHAARRIAMENATDNARDMLADLTLSYNRARQAAITDEIIEIVSGSEAQG